jgi:membrane protein
MSTQGTPAPRSRWSITGLIHPERGHVRAARRSIALVRNATAEAQRSKLPQMAAALAFRTIFSLIPMLVVGLVALRSFYNENDIAQALGQAMEYSGISSIAVDQSEMGPFPPWDPRSGATGPEAALPPADLPDPPTTSDPGTPAAEERPTTAPPAITGSDRLDAWIGDLVNRVSKVNLKAISAIGAIFVIYAAMGMLVEIERAFNQIYRVPRGRSWVRRVMQYWTLLTLGPAGLFATFYVGQKFTAWLARTASLGGPQGEDTLAVAALGYFTTVGISTLLLLLMYLVVPNTRVKLWSALAGAFLAALMWEAGKWGFTQYLHYSAFYSRLYGSIALIPLFLLWVYVTWIIVLVGLQVSYYLQHGRQHTVAQPAEIIEPSIVDPAASLVVMGALARGFESGKPSTAKEIADKLAIQAGIVRQILAALAEAGLVLRIPEENAESRYTLARPVDKTSAEEVLRIGETLANPSAKALDPIAERMRQARIDLVRGRTVADALGVQATKSEPQAEIVISPPAAPPAPPEAEEPPAAGRVDLA